MTTRAQLVAAARLWLDTPFKHQATVRGVGVDCSGLLRGVAADLGLPIVSRTDYGRSPDADSARLLAEVSQNLDPIEVSEARAGDVLLFWFDSPDRPYHFAIVTDVGILHTYTRVRKVVETSLSDGWRSRIHSAWRVRGLED